MGSTNRRPPRLNNIPAAPNYDFLNILEFKGLQKTKNPFTAKVNRASELLNVYVDEHSALTTRPRLEVFNKIKDCRVLTDNIWLGRDDANNLIVIRNKTDIATIRDSAEKIVTDAWVHDDKIYVLAMSGYYVIKGNKLELVTNDDDTYIPTVSVGESVNGEVVDAPYECKNILNHKYYKQLIWDGKSPIETNGGRVVSNEYIAHWNNISSGQYKPRQIVPTAKGFVKIDVEIGTVTDGGVSYTQLSFTNYTFNDDVMSDMTWYGFLPESLYDHDTYYCFNVSVEGQYAVIESNNIVYAVPLTQEYRPTTIEQPDVLTGTTGMVTPNGEVFYSTGDYTLNVKKGGTTNNISVDIIDSKIAGMDRTGSDVILFKTEQNKIEVQKVALAFGNEYALKPVCKIDYNATVSTVPIKKTYDNLYSISSNGKYMAIVIDQKSVASAKDVVLINLDAGTYRRIALNGFNISNIYVGDDLSILIERDNSIEREVYRLIEDKPVFMYSQRKTDYSNSEGTNISYPFLYLTDLASVMGDSFRGVSPSGTLLQSFDLEYSYFLPNTEPKIKVLYTDSETIYLNKLYMHRFNNNFWFYSPDNNIIRWTKNNDPTYICEYDFDDIGADESGVTGMLVLSPNTMMIFKKTKTYILTVNAEGTIAVTESKADIGNIAINNPIITTLKDIPTVVTNNGFYGFQLLKYVESSDRIAECITERINGQLLDEVGFENTITANYKYWTLYSIPTEKTSHIYVLDNRTMEWFYWEIPIVIKRFANIDETLIAIDDNGMYKFLTTEVLVDNTPHSMYYDNTSSGKSVIEWKWKSQILPFKSVNYLKRLISTSFIFADDQYTNEYGIKYRFEAFRKTKDLVDVSTTLDGWVDQVATTTHKTGISKFNFLTIEFSNILAKDLGEYNDKVSYYYNKINIVGLTFKYILMRGSSL